MKLRYANSRQMVIGRKTRNQRTGNARHERDIGIKRDRKEMRVAGLDQPVCRSNWTQA